MNLKATITLGTVVAAFSVLSGVTHYWPNVGWEFPLSHDGDIDELRKAIANEVSADGAARLAFNAQIDKLQQDVQHQIQWGQDRYECDRLNDTLTDLRKQLRANPNDVDLQERIRRIEERRDHDGLNCARFEV